MSAPSMALPLPPPSLTIDLPPPAPNSYDFTPVPIAFGPADGLIYAWDGAHIMKQDGFNVNHFTSIGNVGSGSADPGPITFSADGSHILVGNGFGGKLPGHDGLIFSIPTAGGSSSTPVGNISLHSAFLGAPVPASTSHYFVNFGANPGGTASAVSVLNTTNSSTQLIIQNIPGASTSMTVDGSGRFYVGVGFDDPLVHTGEIRRFDVAALLTAYNTTTPLNWSSGELFNGLNNNSGAGMAFDHEGYFFVGGGQGLTVIDPLGNARIYDNGYTTVTYDPVNNRVFVLGNEQGIYPASVFHIPEPSSAVLALVALACCVAAARRRGRLK